MGRTDTEGVEQGRSWRGRGGWAEGWLLQVGISETDLSWVSEVSDVGWRPEGPEERLMSRKAR